MKTTIKNIAILIAFILSTQHLALRTFFAQTITPPNIPASVFPIGGADFGLDLDYLTDPSKASPGNYGYLTELSNAGMNTIWHCVYGVSDLRQLNSAARMPQGMTAYYSAFVDYNSNGTVKGNGLNNITGSGRTGRYAPEVRYFFATNLDQATLTNHPAFAIETKDRDNFMSSKPDANNVWKNSIVSGQPVLPGGPISSGEWEWTPQNTTDHLQFVLKNDAADNNNAWYINGDYTNSTDMNIVCDFIYSFEGCPILQTEISIWNSIFRMLLMAPRRPRRSPIAAPVFPRISDLKQRGQITLAITPLPAFGLKAVRIGNIQVL